ncbi:hypothetical protein SVAN01_03247 [Stagonosporopsis vannaccii]|nr:hypothetical protein SVAN01_03247 [Stagonosporopsis vannaccii]
MVCDVVQTQPSTRDRFALAVLRVLTFDELGLTHTCCKRFIDRSDAWFYGIHVLDQDPDDLAAIEYSESKDLEALEELMTELEHAWVGFSGTFLVFLRLVWLPLMRKNNQELSAESDSQLAQRLSEVGVILDLPVGIKIGTDETGEGDSQGDAEDKPEYHTPWKEKRVWEKIEWFLEEEEFGYDSSEEPMPPEDLLNRTDNSANLNIRTQNTHFIQHGFELLQDKNAPIGKEQKTPRRRQSI